MFEKNKDNKKTDTDLGVKNIITFKSIEDLLLFMEAKEIILEVLQQFTTNEKIRETYDKIIKIISEEQKMMVDLLALSNGLYMTAYGVMYSACMKRHNDKNKCIKLLYYMNSVFMDIMLGFIYEMPSDVVEMVKGGLGEINKEELFKKINRIGEYIQ